MLSLFYFLNHNMLISFLCVRRSSSSSVGHQIFFPLLTRSRRTSSSYYQNVHRYSSFGSCPHCSSSTKTTTSSSNSSNNTNPKIIRISYFTDVEGDASYLDRFVNQSRVLEFAPSANKKDNYTEPFYDKHIVFQETSEDDVTSMLVFGGDVSDKGGSDLYVLRQLLSLHHRYPQQVKFILGNRDINKMRIWPELKQLSEEEEQKSAVFWHKTKYNNHTSSTLVDRLKWMLSRTMGSPDAFEFRKEELSKEQQQPVTENDVVQSYMETCRPEGIRASFADSTSRGEEKHGLMAQYLNSANIMCKIGSILFFHGALPSPPATTKDESIHCTMKEYFNYAMPWLSSITSTTNKEISTPQQWMDATNQFAAEQISLWNNLTVADIRNKTIWSTAGGYTSNANVVPGGSILQYGMSSLPNKAKNPTVVYNSWLSSSSNNTTASLVTFDHSWLSSFYKMFSIQAIITGHKPHGDMPLPIRVYTSDSPSPNSCEKDTPHWIISCDTSYSGDTIWMNNKRKNLGRGHSKSGRGDCAVRIQSHGVLSDGSIYQSPNLADCKESAFIGHPLNLEKFELCSLVERNNDSTEEEERIDDLEKKSWWVKSKLDHDHYLVCATRDFHVWNAIARLKRV